MIVTKFAAHSSADIFSPWRSLKFAWTFSVVSRWRRSSLHVRIILRSLCDHFRIILASCLDYFGISLSSFRIILDKPPTYIFELPLILLFKQFLNINLCQKGTIV